MSAWMLNTLEVSNLSRFNGFVAGAQNTEPTERWDQIVNDLRRLHDLERDWDGLEATAPSPELVESAIELACSLRKKGVACPSGAVPGMNGTVLLEWQDEGIYMEAEVVSPYEAEWMLVVPGQPAKHWGTR